jgi:hypothetical protein
MVRPPKRTLIPVSAVYDLLSKPFKVDLRIFKADITIADFTCPIVSTLFALGE